MRGRGVGGRARLGVKQVTVTSPGLAFLVTCWGTEPHLTNVDEEMVSTGKHFDKFVYRERKKDATAAGGKEREQGGVFLLFLFQLEKCERFKSYWERKGLGIYSREIK